MIKVTKRKKQKEEEGSKKKLRRMGRLYQREQRVAVAAVCDMASNDWRKIRFIPKNMTASKSEWSTDGSIKCKKMA